MTEDRDLLVEMRADMKHVREGIDHLKSSDLKQWERLDAHGQKIATHDTMLKVAAWAGGIGGTVIGGILLWSFTRGQS